jgi:hypothetical protein
MYLDSAHCANGLFHDANLPASVALSAKALVAAGMASTLVSPHWAREALASA